MRLILDKMLGCKNSLYWLTGPFRSIMETDTDQSHSVRFVNQSENHSYASVQMETDQDTATKTNYKYCSFGEFKLFKSSIL